MDFALLAFLILLNGAFAMSEMALTASRKARLAGHGRGRGAWRAGGDGPARAPHPWLSTVQIGITSIGVLNGIVGENAFAEPLSAWLSQVLQHHAQGGRRSAPRRWWWRPSPT